MFLVIRKEALRDQTYSTMYVRTRSGLHIDVTFFMKIVFFLENRNDTLVDLLNRLVRFQFLVHWIDP